MNLRQLSIGAALACVCLSGCQSPGDTRGFETWNHYGSAQVAAETGAMPLREVDPTVSATVVVKGRVAAVAPDGSWLMLEDGPRSARVKFIAGAVSIPASAVGRRAVVEGMGRPVLVDAQWAREIAAQSGKSRAEVNAINQPVSMYEITAEALYVE